MSRPENTKTHTAPQEPLTAEWDFHVINAEQNHCLRVTPGLPVLDVLEDSSCRLAEVLKFIDDHLDDERGLKVSALYLLQNHLVTAKALVDSSTAGLIRAGHAGGAA